MATPSPDDWFRSLHDEHYAQVLAYLIRRGCPDPEAAAAVVFLVAWRRRCDLHSNREMMPWLYGTARQSSVGQRSDSATNSGTILEISAASNGLRNG